MKKQVTEAANSVRNTIHSIYKEAEKTLFERLPKAAGTILAAAGIVAPLALAVLAYNQGRKDSHPSSFTVMITNRAGTGGGSGSIVETSPSESKILTNAHVCKGALKRGGIVTKVDGEKHRVTGYYLSDEHDLCLVTVAADLHNKVELAASAPALYTEATVTGHPSLMPNVINKGLFGGRMIIDIMTGVRKCTENELNDPSKGLMCMLIGGIPVVESYEAMAVSATIMPGSSGSAVLNSNNELSGVVFAGNSRGLSYAFTVPYEAVRNFLGREMKAKQYGKKLTPWNDESSGDSEEESVKSVSEISDMINKACEDPTNKEKMSDICSKVRNSADLKEIK